MNLLLRIRSYLGRNLIFIIPLLIISLIAYVHLMPVEPEPPCISTTYIVAEITNPGQVYSGKITLNYRYIFHNQVSNEKIKRHYTSLPPEKFDRFYMMVCVRDSSNIAFDLVTDSIPVKPWHVLGVEYPIDSLRMN